jgi:signal transduction histidine kinase
VARAVETSGPLLAAGGQELTVALPSEPLWIEGDATRLAQALGNLLANAAKFTPKGGKVEVAAQAAGGEVVLHVRDTGIGIAADLLPHVFDLFAQGPPLTGSAPAGLGLGLTLVRSLVELHGGTVAAASAGPGQGSELTIRLPAWRTRRGGASPQTTAGADPAAGRPRPGADPGRTAS